MGDDDDDGVATWYCGVCCVLMTLEEALAGRCTSRLVPRRPDCPLARQDVMARQLVRARLLRTLPH
jgi:hypothetical protein